MRLRAAWDQLWVQPQLLRRVLQDFGPAAWRRYLAAAVLMGMTVACTAGIAHLVGRLINETYLSRSFAAVVALSLVAVALFAIKGFAIYGQTVLLARLTNDLTAEIQQRMFDKLVQQELGYFAERPSPLVMSQVTYGAGAVPALLNLLVTSLGRDALMLVALAAVMVAQDPLLSLVGLIVLPTAVVSVRAVTRHMRATAMDQFAGGASLMDTMQETLQGLRIVKAFDMEAEMRRRVREGAALMRRAGNTMAALINRASPLMETMGGVAVALVFLYGGYRVLELGEPPGGFVAFIVAFLLAYEPAKRLARLHVTLQTMLPGVGMAYEILDLPARAAAEARKPALAVERGRIEFRDVVFGYRADAPALRGLSLVAEPQAMTALVGSSGAGKSTTFNLLLRLYEAGGGSILIDGQDVAAVSPASLRRQIAYVGQDVFLFRASIRDNIRYGRPDASLDEIEAAARAAHAHDFITGFPAGYDTPVGEHGLALSTGQRARIAIARALVRHAPIILLDEPTAALDSESEQLVQDAMARLCAGRTTLVIAHRLSTVLHAGCIHVIEAGRVVESGPHHALLARGGRYRALFDRQFAGPAPALTT